MKQGKLVLANFDARIPKIEIKPKNTETIVTISSKMFDEEIGKKISVKLRFYNVVAIDFRINYFDNMIGAEGFGLYEIKSREFVDNILKENFRKRREIYLLEGDYNYEEDDPHDLLNSFDLLKQYTKEKKQYRAYVQNVDAGVYVIIAKGVEVIR